MIDNLNEYLMGIVIGVRYRVNFSLEDQFGKIVDQILYSPNAFFGPKFFPLVYNNPNEKILINEETNNKLTLNNSNVVLEIFFDDNITVDDIDNIYDSFNDEIIESVLRKYKVTEINRVGIVHRYLFKIEKLADEFVDKTIGSTLEGINDINLRFSKKYTSEEGLSKKEVNDYYSAIFNVVKRADKNELLMSIDYQKYFDPFLTSSSSIEFLDFVKRTNSFNSKTYLGWLNKNYGQLK